MSGYYVLSLCLKGIEMMGMEFREGRAEGSVRIVEGWRGGN